VAARARAADIAIIFIAFCFTIRNDFAASFGFGRLPSLGNCFFSHGIKCAEPAERASTRLERITGSNPKSMEVVEWFRPFNSQNSGIFADNEFLFAFVSLRVVFP